MYSRQIIQLRNYPLIRTTRFISANPCVTSSYKTNTEPFNLRKEPQNAPNVYRFTQSGPLASDAFTLAAASKATKLIYVQKPWTYVKNKLKMKAFQYNWDNQFNEDEFKRGATQAIIMLTDLMREKKLVEIRDITTPTGYAQISQDLEISHTDPRVQLLRFRTEDIRRQIPVGIHLLVSKQGTKRHCVIDMFFVGLRKAEDMASADADGLSVRRNMQLFRQQHDFDTRRGDFDPEHSAVFAELYVRFHREYTEFGESPWNIAFFKVASFNLLNLK